MDFVTQFIECGQTHHDDTLGTSICTMGLKLKRASKVFIDGENNFKGASIGVVIWDEEPNFHGYSLRIAFYVINYVVGYEALYSM